LDEAPASPGASPRKQHALQLFSGLPRHYDRAGAALSFGQDPRWRRALVAAVDPARDARVLDVATGTGMVAAALVRASGCRVVGLDQSPEMLGAARVRIAGSPQLRERITLIQGEAERLPFADREFDALTFTYLLRYIDDPPGTLRELARVVRPGGRIAALEFGVPRQPLLRALWRLHTRAGLPALGRALSREWYEVGRFLGPSIEDFYARLPLARQLELWREAGIGSLAVRSLSLGAGIVIGGVRE
jgi:demethylmenaquinone methyltransferase/2-methoxy-6-polyprenyl-1,4-benzoquinol methylase